MRLLSGVEKPKKPSSPFDLFGVLTGDKGEQADLNSVEQGRIEEIRGKYHRGELENELVSIEVAESNPVLPGMVGVSGLDELGQGLQEFMTTMMPKKMNIRRLPVKEAREILIQQEIEKLIDREEVYRQAITKVEESGIVFIDEIDKIVGGHGETGPDVSREGVQRDILPIVEGTTVWTKYGPVKTDYILFIAAGAFHVSKPSELIPEFQGRFPIRVELESLTVEDFERILVEPENALLRQEKALLESEGLVLEFTPDAIRTLAEIAYHLNKENENIGARRLYTILEQVLEDLSFRLKNIKEKPLPLMPNLSAKAGPDIEENGLSRFICKLITRR